jgi:hypothetical protein
MITSAAPSPCSVATGASEEEREKLMNNLPSH